MQHIILELAALFNTFGVLNATTFENLNYVMKMFIRNTSMDPKFMYEEAVRLISSSIANDEDSSVMKSQKNNSQTRHRRCFSFFGGHWDMYLHILRHWQGYKKFTYLAQFENFSKLIHTS